MKYYPEQESFTLSRAERRAAGVPRRSRNIPADLGCISTMMTATEDEAVGHMRDAEISGYTRSRLRYERQAVERFVLLAAAADTLILYGGMLDVPLEARPPLQSLNDEAASFGD